MRSAALTAAGVTAVDHHPGAEGGEKFGDREPDAAGATDDDGAAAGRAVR